MSGSHSVRLLVALCSVIFVPAAVDARQAGPPPGFHQPLTAILDTYVRDGFVYYAALKSDRARLDRYVASLDSPAARNVAAWPAADQQAFWLNAYNALVLRTVIDRYPIRGRDPQYPGNSIRQIPGAFDRKTWPVAGRQLTLDAIENQVLAAYGDPRLFLALGRGAAGSGRLRSEAYTGDRLARQLDDVGAEFVSRSQMLQVDRAGGSVRVTPIVGWHEPAFAQAYAAQAPAAIGNRTPIERAVVALAWPHLLPSEREFVERNDFRFGYLDFDWRLNDLVGRWR